MGVVDTFSTPPRTARISGLEMTIFFYFDVYILHKVIDDFGTTLP